jgi:pimeloyl-ACP methyl ester carboxylesterase
VLALDARGHGRSERAPLDVSPDARAADVCFQIERLSCGPVVLVGQSLGGQTALLVAAERPELVRGLVLVDAGPEGDGEAAVTEVEEALAGWPLPFASRQAAVEFFDGPSLAAELWADGLEQRSDGWHPRFQLDVMSRMLREATSRSYWEEWERIGCPALVVRAGEGVLADAEVEEMTARRPNARVVTVDGAEHDLHLDRPDQWRRVMSKFLDELNRPPAS